jgi:hypothetical protein
MGKKQNLFLLTKKGDMGVSPLLHNIVLEFLIIAIRMENNLKEFK